MKRLNSSLNKKMLETLTMYKILPNNLELILAAYPEFESVKKLKRRYENLHAEGLVEKINVLEYRKRMRNERDAIQLTKYGSKFAEEIGIGKSRLYKDVKISNSSKIQIYYATEFDLLFRAYKNWLSNLSTQIDIPLLNVFGGILDGDFGGRRMLFRHIQNQGIDTKPMSSSRISGLVVTKSKQYLVYNIQGNNISLNYKNEISTMQGIAKAFQFKKIDGSNQVLYSTDYSTVKRLFGLNYTPKDFDWQQAIHRPKNFDLSRKQYFIVNKPEQVLQIFLLHFNNNAKDNSMQDTCEKLVKQYIISNNRQKQFIEPRYSPVSTYETDEEIGFDITCQELNHLEMVYWQIKDIRESHLSDKRRIIVYGTSANKEIFKTLYMQFENVYFMEINTTNLVHSLMVYVQ